METKKEIIEYDTGCQQKLPLFSYSGMTYEEAKNIIEEKTGLKNFELVDPSVIQKKHEGIKECYQPQWYIYRWKDLVTGKYF